MIPASVVVFFIVLFIVLGIMDEFLIILAVSIVAGIIWGVVQAVMDKKKGTTNIQKKPIKKQKSEEEILEEAIMYDMLNKQIKKKQQKKNQKDYTEYWETHCESCGELLEDCECDWKRQSKQDISQDEMDDLEFDEMMDYWDELDAEDDDF